MGAIGSIVGVMACLEFVGSFWISTISLAKCSTCRKPGNVYRDHLVLFLQMQSMKDSNNRLFNLPKHAKL
jgi:hypothetical protein